MERSCIRRCAAVVGLSVIGLASLAGGARAQSQAPSWSAQVVPTDQLGKVLATTTVPSAPTVPVLTVPVITVPTLAPPAPTLAPKDSVPVAVVVEPTTTVKRRKRTVAKSTTTTVEPVKAAAAPASPEGETDDEVAGGVWAALRKCESGGRYNINTGNGFFGAYQFTLSTWRSLGYSGYPHEAAPSVQDEAARKLQAKAGWGQWPACSRKLGLR